LLWLAELLRRWWAMLPDQQRLPGAADLRHHGRAGNRPHNLLVGDAHEQPLLGSDNRLHGGRRLSVRGNWQREMRLCRAPRLARSEHERVAEHFRLRSRQRRQLSDERRGGVRRRGLRASCPDITDPSCSCTYPFWHWTSTSQSWNPRSEAFFLVFTTALSPGPAGSYPKDYTLAVRAVRRGL